MEPADQGDASVRQLRRILPAGPAPGANYAGFGTPRLGPVGTHDGRVLPKNVHVKAACDACRKRKIKVR